MIQLKVHVVDDTKAMLIGVKESLKKSSGQLCSSSGEAIFFDVDTFCSAAQWREQFIPKVTHPDVLLLDISMDGDDEAGLKLTNFVREVLPEAVVVMFSQFDDAETILRFMAAGADSFISKKSKFADIPGELLEAYFVSLKKRPVIGGVATIDFSEICVGTTMKNIGRRVAQILNSAVRSVHVCGETGSGKEVVADLFETVLRKANAAIPFVRINCGAISPSLLESELFGHKKGAFTGAQSDRVGLVETANGGWIFLDEVSTLSNSAQVALLRVIENQELVRVGESRAKKIDVKVISACNEDLQEKVRLGFFRRDLWQRLAELTIPIAPLRERREEIPELISFFAYRMSAGRSPSYSVTPAALEILKSYSWSGGNVRELRNCLRAMTEYSSNRVLGPNCIPRHIFEGILKAEKTQISSVVTSKKIEAAMGFQIFDSKYSDLEEQLFAETIMYHVTHLPVVTLRSLEEATGLSRMTISRRIKQAIEKGTMQASQLPAEFLARNGNSL